MKKLLFITLIAFSAGLFSCHAKNDYKVSEAENDEAVAAVENSLNVAYKIENSKIIPTNGLPTIIDFSATWCPPCRQLKPIFSKLEEEFKGRINFITIDVDDNPSIAQYYGVQSIPMLIFMDPNGQIKNTLVGFQTRDQLLETINTYFGF
ncbi:MAG: thioredoxin family protein [Muribaculaceae bacterium]|nr:thioredoxin family protein [Muribaculaceae bacterium]